MRVVWLAALLALAGCSEATDPAEPPGGGDEFAGADLRGVVVDQSIAPIEGATVTLVATGAETTTNEAGAFAFDGLEAGTYFLRAGHPFYSEAQVSAEVNPGASQVVKIQLTRVEFREPYTSQQEVKGFLFCSSNVAGVIAEECGEGVGVPCESPVFGCQRVGGTPENRPDATFFVDGPHVATIQAEVVWDSTFTIGSGVQEGGFTAIMATQFVCDPVCGYEDSLDDKVGHSPLIMRTDDGNQGGSYFTAPDVALANATITAETPISVFVWTSDDDLAAITFDQPFTVYVTASYILPLPDDWALVNGDDVPF